MSSMRQKKYNVYDLTGDFGIGIAGTGEKFIFDIEDYEKIKNYYWRVSKPTKKHPKIGGYVVSNSLNQKWVTLSRIIMDCPKEMVVDHKNHNKLDNRKENLRVCLFSENQRNRNFPGVTFHKRQKKYIATISLNKKRIQIGSFPTYEEARAARIKAEEKYFGEFAFSNNTGGIG
jgi:hypothetical protein